MKLITVIETLQTSPQHKEEEYEHTSEFIEWFYTNLICEEGFDEWPLLHLVSFNPEFKEKKQICKNLVNINYIKALSEEDITKEAEQLKVWLVKTIKRYDE